MNQHNELIKKLRAMYKEKLEAKLKELQFQLGNAGRDWRQEKGKLFYKTLHQFNGSAGSHGYPEISQALGELEIYVKPLMEEGALLTPEQEKHIATLMEEIKKNVTQAMMEE